MLALRKEFMFLDCTAQLGWLFRLDVDHANAKCWCGLCEHACAVKGRLDGVQLLRGCLTQIQHVNHERRVVAWLDSRNEAELADIWHFHGDGAALNSRQQRVYGMLGIGERHFDLNVTRFGLRDSERDGQRNKREAEQNPPHRPPFRRFVP